MYVFITEIIIIADVFLTLVFIYKKEIKENKIKKTRKYCIHLRIKKKNLILFQINLKNLLFFI